MFYITHDKLLPQNIHKIGKSKDINDTLSQYRRNAPNTVLDYLIYLSKDTYGLIETCMLTSFKDNRDQNHEVIQNIKSETLIQVLLDTCSLMKIAYTVVDENAKQSFNDYITCSSYD